MRIRKWIIEANNGSGREEDDIDGFVHIWVVS